MKIPSKIAIALVMLVGTSSAMNWLPETTFLPGSGWSMDETTPGDVEMWGGNLRNSTLGNSSTFTYIGTSLWNDIIVDGTSDETEINTAISIGKPISMEAGVIFHIDGKILPVNGTDIRGNGAIISREMNDSAIWADGKNNITISDLIIDANEDTYTLDYQHPLYIVNSTYIWLDKVFVYGAPNNANGINIGSQNGAVDAAENLGRFIWVTRCGASGCNGDSLYFYNLDFAVVDDFVSDGSGICAVDFFGSNYISASGISARGGGAANYLVNIDKCENSSFEVVVDCNGTGYPGLYVTHGDGNTISGTIGNVDSSDNNAIILGESNNTIVHDMSIHGGSINIFGGDRNVIVDTILQCDNVTTSGISISSGATNTTIDNVHIIDPIIYGLYSDSCPVRLMGSYIYGATYGIYLAGTAAGGCSYSQIVGNRIDSSWTYGVYGLDNGEANANQNVAVVDNIITNSGTNSIITTANSNYWLIDGNVLGGGATSLAGANNVVGDNMA